MDEFDVIVVGSGAGGLCAAIVAAQQGLKVLVVEKAKVFGGTTALSGGMAWIPDNHHMKAKGVEDSRDQADTYLRAVLGNWYDGARVGAFLDAAPEMLRHMEATTELRFFASPTPDYQPNNPGATNHRGVVAVEYDGSRLGDHLQYLRRPYTEFTVFDTMQVAGADVVPLRKAFRSAAGFKHTTRMLLRHAAQVARHGRGTRLVAGNALAGRLLKSALDAGVTLWRETPALRLTRDDDRVTGLVVRREGREVALTARRGVVLAAGGFGANDELRQKFMPLADHHVSIQPEDNQGDGIQMGIGVGGRLVADNPSNGIYIPVSRVKDENGRERRFPHIMIDRYMPGSIAVDPQGKRFVNEADSYQNFVMTMQSLGLPKVHMIAGHDFLRRYGMGLARPFPYSVKKWIRNGYLIEAQTIAELAGKIGADPAVLEATVKRFNDFAARGEDPDFHRGEDAHSRFRGDQENKPNPSVAPVGPGPYYAIALIPGDLSSVAGLATDERARVLDGEDKPVKGLYAVGLDMNSLSRGLYPAGGSSLGPALTFGYIAAKDIIAGA
ncbi:FAD-dependent oxidoreductase [Ruixingdingia sedimenti]|uniref:FAD-dependent oxidoreductase n=1 Tax=Ruixingdingia sedimenti TaxID=3073604 RepID=A0ABU1F3Y4_9RHOB|nr:FAD-dependent oxidoreductase [Xinfangfangia sp. LG-4]MDR5651182.1 FAD-dependent oxidoreductase [Xinfangfangia sp. LG-4]